MRGLIMKDMLTIAKQAKAFLILIYTVFCRHSQLFGEQLRHAICGHDAYKRVGIR